MADYTIWMIGESQVSLSGGTQLDGVTQGSGIHLRGQTLTIDRGASTQINISDSGSETAFADNDGGQRLNGAQEVDGVTYNSGTRVEAEYEFVLVDDSTGEEYRVLAVNFVTSDGLPSYGSVEGLAFVDQAPPVGVELRVLSTREGPRNSGSSAVDASDIVPVCLCEGTLVRTARGDIAVEDLAPGELIVVAGGETKVLGRVLSSRFGAEELAENPKLYPVRIVAGALGAGLPARDLLVSRQHRMLVSSKIVANQTGAPEALISAIRLVGLPGVFVDHSLREVAYFHVVLEEHAIIFAEGCPTESLLLGPGLKTQLPPEALQELTLCYPDLNWQEPAPAAPILSAKTQRKIAHLHASNGRPLHG